MTKRISHKKLFIPTLLAFATALFVIPTATAMPVIDPGTAVTPHSSVVPISAASDGWYSAVVKAPAVSAPTAVTPTSANEFPYRTIGIASAFGLLLAAVVATAVVKGRRERHIPVLQ